MDQESPYNSKVFADLSKPFTIPNFECLWIFRGKIDMIT